ncbi:MAG: enoyl-CoA hydratase/isomerase family protein [Frankiales bacterium]|nr:enoyl-CoA hydratase/isomerase family protein [Frankiales bacterium]
MRRVLDVEGLRLGVPAPEVDGDDVHGALLLLDLDALPPPARLAALLPEVLAALAARSALVVGVAREPLTPQAVLLAEALDLTVAPEGPSSVVPRPDVEAAVALLEAAVREGPRASLVLAALLRTTPLLPVPEALAAEAAGYSTLLAGPEHAQWLARRGPARPAPEEGPRVSVHREGDLLRVRLTRPRRRNALDAAMRVALLDALEVARADPGVRVQLTGEGPVFCSGGDLDEFGRLRDPATAWVVRTAGSPGALLHLLRERVEVHVQGACAGAGTELPAFATRVTAAPGTTFRLPELDMGLLPGAGGTVSLPRRIGRWRTCWLALTGLPLDATDALAWGLVDDVHD